jgi:hypothetical protein
MALLVLTMGNCNQPYNLWLSMDFQQIRPLWVRHGLSMSGTKMDKEGFRLGNKAHPAGGSLTVPPCGHSSIAMKGIMYA